MNTNGQKTEITVSVEFIKLARSLLDAQQEAQHSQKAFRRAKSLEQIFRGKLEVIEKEVARLQRLNKPVELPLVSGEQ